MLLPAPVTISTPKIRSPLQTWLPTPSPPGCRRDGISKLDSEKREVKLTISVYVARVWSTRRITVAYSETREAKSPAADERCAAETRAGKVDDSSRGRTPFVDVF